MSLDRYNNVFVVTFGVSEEELDERFTFAGTPQWNSLAHMELVANLEDAFDIMLEPDEMINFGSYEHGKEIMRAHGVEIK